MYFMQRNGGKLKSTSKTFIYVVEIKVDQLITFSIDKHYETTESGFFFKLLL